MSSSGVVTVVALSGLAETEPGYVPAGASSQGELFDTMKCRVCRI